MRYVVAIRQASIAASKQSDGDRGATIGTGDSPLRPNIACSRSDCSVLVGSPVDGPPRWTSTTTSGSSSDTASPMVSDFRATPGPDVVVTAREPPNAAPRAAPPAFGEQAARQILREGSGVALSLKPLAGERDQNFRVDTAAGQRFLFKTSDPADDGAILEMQAAALRHIE